MGNFCVVAVFWPDETLMTSTITAGAMPALTPATIASAEIAMAAADMRLLHSFIIWAEPGAAPMKNTLPRCDSSGCNRS